MAIQTSGAISLSDIQTEFGGSNPIALSEYYGVSGGIPASGEISISDFYGASSGWTVTEGGSTSLAGYIDGTQGSISPTTYNSAFIEALYYFELNVKGSITHYIYVQISGNRAQSFFSSITNNDFGTLNTSGTNSFEYNSSNDNTTWGWILSSDPTTWDGTGTQVVTFA